MWSQRRFKELDRQAMERRTAGNCLVRDGKGGLVGEEAIPRPQVFWASFMRIPIVTVRSEEPGDFAPVRVVHESAFPSAAEAALVDALRASGRLTVSLVAEVEGRVVGHIAFSPVTVAGGLAGVGLAPVAVVPAWQRRGVGSQLVRAGLDACARLPDALQGVVVVLGEPEWYGRFGFLPGGRWGLTDEYGGGDAFQAIELRPGTVPQKGGLVRYAPEFAAFA
jgi:putative acetyltransferase